MTFDLLAAPGNNHRIARRCRGSAAVFCAVVFWCMALAAAADQTVYRVIDAQGRVSYTDTPPKDGEAEPVTLREINTQPAMESGKAAPTAKDTAAVPYTRVEIVSPANDTTVEPGQLNVVVQLQLEPALQAGHKIQFYLDDAPQGPAAVTTAITLGDLERGSRSIRAAVVDAQGAPVAQSNAVVIHVKRPSVNFKRR